MIKKISVEKAIHVILILAAYLFAKPLLTTGNFERTWLETFQFYFTVTTWIAIFYVQIYWLFPKYAMNKKLFRYFFILIMIVLGFFLVHSTIQTFVSQNQVLRKGFVVKGFFEIYLSLYNTYVWWFMIIAAILVISIIYSFLKLFFQILVNKGLIKARVLILLIVSTISLVSAFYIGRYYYYASFGGNAKIIFIPNSEDIKTMENLTELPEFKGNILYLDIWGTYCGPCMREFQHGKEIKELKERYMGKPVKFIYLADGGSNDLSRWKRIVDKYELHGYHMLIGALFYKNLMSIKGISESKPLYILIDKKGDIANPNAKRPSSKTEVYGQIDKLLFNH